MRKYRVQFEIDEVVEAEDRTVAIDEAIGKVVGGGWFENELTEHIRWNASTEEIEEDEEIL